MLHEEEAEFLLSANDGTGNLKGFKIAHRRLKGIPYFLLDHNIYLYHLYRTIVGIIPKSFWRGYYRSVRENFSTVVLGSPYETATTNILLSLVTLETTVVDVGANIGYYTMLLAPRCKMVYAIEASPRNIPLLRRNVSGLTNVKVIPFGAWDKEGVLPFRISAEHQGRDSFIWNITEKTIQIKCITLDYVIPPTSPLMLKLDVEGAEHRVLAGAANLLKSGHVKYIVLEWSKWHYKNIDDIRRKFEIMASLGSVFEISERGLFRVSSLNYTRPEGRRVESCEVR